MATKKAAKTKSRRTVLYSAGGKKLYAVRDASGKFKDIQQYARAHAMDIKRGSAAEAAAAGKAAKKVARKVAKAATTAKKAVARKAPGKSAVKKAVRKVAKRATTARKAAGKLVDRLRSAVARARRSA